MSSGIISGVIPQKWLPVPFMTVAAMEHYPANLSRRITLECVL